METTLFKDKYRIKSTRLENWDYSCDGMYFVTVCTRNRECCFGNIEDGTMKLSDIGQIVQQYWNDIPKYYPNVELDEFVIMPNHVHGIIVINENDGHQFRRDEAMPRLYNGKFPQMSKISPKPNSLSSIIGSYKSVCTKQIRQLHNPNFQWQARFYDHIIRNDKSLNKICEYIHNNPAQWEFDRNNPNNPSIRDVKRSTI